MVEQLMQQVQYGPGPPIRTLIGRNLATLFSVGDPFPLFNTVNRCNDALKAKDEVAKLFVNDSLMMMIDENIYILF